MTKFLNISTDNTLGGNSPSNEVVPSQKAIKEYVDNNGGSVSTDGISINQNSSNELQTIGVINQNNTSQAINVWSGTKAQYDLLTPDPNTIYHIIDDETPASFANTDLSNLSATGQGVIDGKVSKSGDTMSGELTAPSLTVKNQNITKGTSPASTQYSQFTFKSNDSGGSWERARLGIIELRTNTDGSNEIGLSAYKNEADSTANSKIWAKIDSSGNKSCGFPDTTCVDGQWVSSYKEIASGVSGTSSYSNDFDLSSYLPNDGKKYEVLLHAEGRTGTTSGNSLRIYISSAETHPVLVAGQQTRTSNYMFGAGASIIPVGTDRKITMEFSYQTGTNSGVGIHAHAYRRIGTNS